MRVTWLFTKDSSVNLECLVDSSVFEWKGQCHFKTKTYIFSGGCINKVFFFQALYHQICEASRSSNETRKREKKKHLPLLFRMTAINLPLKWRVFCAMWKHKPLEGSSEHNRSYWTTITVTSQIMRPKTLKLFRSLGNNPQTILKFIKSLGNICEHNCCLMDFMQIVLLVTHKFSNSRNLISVLKSIESSLWPVPQGQTEMSTRMMWHL